MVTTEALKLLYKKLGGTADVESITSISDMVDLIEDVAGGGGGGGASGLKVTVTVDSTGGTPVYTLDKNYTEIMAVVNNGITPIFQMSSEGSYRYLLFGGSAEVEYEGQTIYVIALYVPNRSTVDGLVVIQFMSDSATGTLVGQED